VFWWILDGVLDGDWWPLFWVFLLVITLLTVGFLMSTKAGSAIPVKFSLGGNQGLNIFATGSPSSATTACTSTDPVDAIEETVAAGGSGLTYDATTGQYIYVWKTEKGWANTCRQLVMKLTDGSSHRANIKFSK